MLLLNSTILGLWVLHLSLCLLEGTVSIYYIRWFRTTGWPWCTVQPVTELFGSCRIKTFS